MLKDHQDAYGHAFYDYYTKKKGYEIAERDDGYLDLSEDLESYFFEFDQWPSHVKNVISFAEGTILDIGCGVGRHSLYLQEQGYTATGIDISPLAIKVCRLRGLKKAEILSITEITPTFGVFDTVLMLGFNFGLVGNVRRARWLLRRFRKITTERGKILTETYNPYQTDRPEHLDYLEYNKKRGRMPGQLRLRMRYRKYATPWFDYLTVSQEEMKEIVTGTGWVVTEFMDGEGGEYCAVIEKS